MFLENLITYFLSLEGLATVLSISYLILAIKQNNWCWVVGIMSCTIFLYVVFKVNLYMESALQVFYIFISFYGLWRWKFSNTEDDKESKKLLITSWNLKQHLMAISTIIGLALLSGFILKNTTDAAMPFIDSLTSWGGVVATYMVANKVFENWHYWFVIDSVSIYLFYTRELYLFAFLFAVYLILIIFGYFEWKKSMTNQFKSHAT